MSLARTDQGNSPPPAWRRAALGAPLLPIASGVLLTAVGAWLFVAAAVLDIEYYDGLSAICNARYFLGQSVFYVFDRGPFMAWMQMPAEALKGWLALHPLDFRPHHATMALVHVAYLLGVYRALVDRLGHRWSTLAAFATAVTSYTFFSYAPFLSHDLAPGALFLWMVIWSDDVAREPRVGAWLLLVAAGTVGPLVKQTYGIFWIAVLAAHGLPMLLHHNAPYRTSRRALAWLAAGAAASGVLTWTIYGVVLANWAPDASLWLRPYRNLQYLAHVYDGIDATFPLWIYVRNLWAYGRLTTLLLIPGIVFSLAGTPLQRRVAIAWITAFVFMHVMPLREVRYIAFLAPLSAFMIVPGVRMLGQSRPGRVLIAALLLLDVGGAVAEASKIGTPFYRRSELRAFLEPLSVNGRLRSPIFHNVSMLSFVAPDQSPLAADRYHRIFHVGVHHIGVLFGYAPDQIRIVPPPQTVRSIAKVPDDTVLLFSNGILAHGPTWVPAPPVGADSFVQGLATLQTIVLRRRPDGDYQKANGNRVAVHAIEDGSHRGLVVSGTDLRETVHGYLMPVAIFPGDEVRPLQHRPDGSLLVAGPESGTPAARPDPLVIRLFVIQRLSGRPIVSIDPR